MLEWREQYRTYPWGQLPELVCRFGGYVASVYEDPAAEPDEPPYTVEYYAEEDLDGTGPAEPLDYEFAATLAEAKAQAERWLRENAIS